MLKGTVIEIRYYHLLERYLVPLLMHLRVKPNHVSLAGLVTSLMAGVAFAYRPFWGGLLTWLTGLLDNLDGCLARVSGQGEKYGAFLDSVLDRYTELIIYLGMWFYFYRNGAATPFISLLLVLILFGSLMVSYTRARAEGLGVHCLVGLFQRGERILLIGLAGMANPLCNALFRSLDVHWIKDIFLVTTLLVLTVGTNLTALWRFLHVLNSLRRS
jgi:CDP-diacylglycerol--glycerol-3-phosphate 3-phosphatidyltransferase